MFFFNKIQVILIIIFLIIIFYQLYIKFYKIKEHQTEDSSKIKGCTYSDAKNYNVNATEDDGSCEYTFQDVSKNYVAMKNSLSLIENQFDSFITNIDDNYLTLNKYVKYDNNKGSNVINIFTDSWKSSTDNYKAVYDKEYLNEDGEVTVYEFKYNPKVDKSEILIDFDTNYKIGSGSSNSGTYNFTSKLYVNNIELAKKVQYFHDNNRDSGGTRSNTMFPLSTVYNNSTGEEITIKIIITSNTNTDSNWYQLKDKWMFKILEYIN